MPKLANGFAGADEYYLLNGGSHLKPPARVGAPALTWHVALWIASLDKLPALETATATFRERRGAWLRVVDWFLASFARQAYRVWSENYEERDPEHRMRPHAFTEHAESGDGNGDFTLFRHRVANVYDLKSGSLNFDRLDGREVDQYRNEAFSFKFFFAGIPMKLRAALHAEFVSLTFIAELHQVHERFREDGVPRALVTYFDDLSNALGPRLYELSAGVRNEKHDSDYEPPETTSVKAKLGEAPNYLYNGFWEKDFWRFYSDSLRPDFNIQIRRTGDDGKMFDVGKPHAYYDLTESIGPAFADFRSVILSGELRKDELPNLDVALRWEIDRPFVPHVQAETGLGLQDLTSREALAVVDTLVPVLEAAQLREEHGDATRAGRQREATSAGKAGEFRMGLEHTAAQFLDGHVVYLSSLAAYRRWSANAGERPCEPLRYLLVYPRRNRWQLGRLIERLHLLGSLRLASLKDLTILNGAGEQLRSFGVKVDAAEKAAERGHSLNKDLANIGDGCDGGFLYRIDRSRYYVTTFRALRQLLRIRRIEGYQPYDEFVDQRVGSTWDSIDRLGDRWERARRRIDSINANIQAGEQQAQTIEQTELLRIAEIVAVVAVGYYGGHILAELTPLTAPALHALFPNVHLSPQWGEQVRGGLWSIAAMLLYVLLLPVLRWVIDKKARERMRVRLTGLARSMLGRKPAAEAQPAVSGDPPLTA
ncbi:MAG: hypothetical protein JWM87_603 [Candidatus Eremiobacteraeota bacterium]|nr:hypothetical protein [Candidatus Eremiobacteraeota bacterium]